MNRNIEWEGFIREIGSAVPPQLEYSAQRAVLRTRRNQALLRLPIAGAFAGLVLFAALAHTSAGFVQAIVNIPLLGGLARIVSDLRLQAGRRAV